MSKDRLKGVKTLAAGDLLADMEKEAIVHSTDLVSLFASFGVSLSKKGKSFMGKCPWHDDTNPSLSVDPTKGVYHCFGCGESGDAITLVQKMKNVSFKDALSYLKSNSFTAASSSYDSPHVQPPSEEAISTVNIDDIAHYYQKKFSESKDAHSYMEKRGFTDPSLLSRFGIGFADSSLLSMIGEEQKKALMTYGVLNDKGYEHFGGCITVPLYDAAGKVVGFYGRVIDDTRTTKHLYLKGTHKGLFNRTASRVYDEVVLAESVIDAMSLVAIGVENTQAIYGVNGFTEDHLRTLKDDRVKTIIIAFDNDDVGHIASETLKEKLRAEGFTIKVIVPPTGKDWNDYFVSGGTVELIKKSILDAELFPSSVVPSALSSRAGSFENITKEGLYYIAKTGDVEYRISGVKDMFAGSLKVAVKASDTSGNTYVDTLELYSARARSSFSMNFSRMCSMESSRIEKDIVALLVYFETERDKQLYQTTNIVREELTPEERELGLSLLKDPDIFTRIVRDMDMLGYVGEEVNKKLLYLAASSRILDDPLSVLILSQSASGKSFLVDTVKKLMPPEDVIAVTSLSDQALNYVEDLLHKFLILGEAVHSDSVEHQIREMLSGKELSRMVTVKDEKSGTMKSRVVRRPVIVSAVMSGTNHAINPENASRCFVVSTDESREQTRRIHASQREKYSLGRHAAKEKDLPDIIRMHHAAQKLLRKVRVINPFAQHLGFPDALMRSRRDHDRFMDLIACVAFLRQYQKEEKTDGSLTFIECDDTDYSIAYEIMVHGVLSTTMSDTPRGVIDFYEMLRVYAKEKADVAGIDVHEASFTQREIRERTNYSQTWVKTQMRILLDYEYLVAVRGGSSRSKGVYRIREDRSFEDVNLSMIPSPDEMKKLSSQTGHSEH